MDDEGTDKARCERCLRLLEPGDRARCRFCRGRELEDDVPSGEDGEDGQ